MHVFWPRHSRGSARNNLNVSLYNLRRTLADGRPDRHILYADGCYQLNPEISWWIDRTQFLARLPEAQMHLQSGDATAAVAAYQAAVALYRGPLFEDDTTSDWHLGEQAHLADLYLDALERLGELHLETIRVVSRLTASSCAATPSARSTTWSPASSRSARPACAGSSASRRRPRPSRSASRSRRGDRPCPAPPGGARHPTG
jgi:DNA-binding SARP family transcriptional activator